jgi:hypothetical protein
MVTATRGSSTFPVPGTGVLRVAWGTYTHATNLAATTTIDYCRIPAGAVVTGGYWCATDLDTNGSEEINIDIGWAANGVEIADPDGFGNLDVLTGDVSVHLPVASIWVPLQGVLIATGPQAFSAETLLQAVINVDAATGGTGQSTLVAYFYTP